MEKDSGNDDEHLGVCHHLVNRTVRPLVGPLMQQVVNKTNGATYQIGVDVVVLGDHRPVAEVSREELLRRLRVHADE